MSKVLKLNNPHRLGVLLISTALVSLLMLAAVLIQRDVLAHTGGHTDHPHPNHWFFVLRNQQSAPVIANDKVSISMTLSAQIMDEHTYDGNFSFKWYRYERCVAQGNVIGNSANPADYTYTIETIPTTQAQCADGTTPSAREMQRNIYKNGTGTTITDILEGISIDDLIRYKRAEVNGDQWPKLQIAFAATATDAPSNLENYKINSGKQHIDFSGVTMAQLEAIKAHETANNQGRGRDANATVERVTDTNSESQLLLVALVSLGVAASVACSKIWLKMYHRNNL